MKIIEYSCRKDIIFIKDYQEKIVEVIHRGTYYSYLVEDDGINKKIEWFEKSKIG